MRPAKLEVDYGIRSLRSRYCNVAQATFDRHILLLISRRSLQSFRIYGTGSLATIHH
jgi:hypothetical protein